MLQNIVVRFTHLRLRTKVLLIITSFLAIVVAMTAWTSLAATPSSGTLSEGTPVLNYDAGLFNTANQSPLGLGQLDQGPRCNGTTFPCDSYALTISLPAGYAAQHPNASAKATMYWADTGSGQSDYDLYIYRGNVTTLNGSQAADYQSAGGANPGTGRIMVMNSGPIWRLTPPEHLLQAKPECCDALWEDRSADTTNIGVDPILWADQVTTEPKSARMFASNSTAGTNGVYAFSDNDGDTWNPLSASPPNGSSDHETIGSGPYPASLSALANATNHGHAVYYCAQTFPVGAAACQRSDTYGLSYGPSTFPYTGNLGDPCGGIHGHVHVGPDGTVYLPVRDCSGSAGVSVSTDAGITWT